MKQVLLSSLIALNLVLLAVLMLGPSTQPADAQVRTGSQDYLMVTSRVDETGRDAAFILDLKKKRLMGIRLQPAAGGSYRVEEIVGRSLSKDFGE
jgi:hypothetical protein